MSLPHQVHLKSCIRVFCFCFFPFSKIWLMSMGKIQRNWKENPPQCQTFLVLGLGKEDMEKLQGSHSTESLWLFLSRPACSLCWAVSSEWGMFLNSGISNTFFWHFFYALKMNVYKCWWLGDVLRYINKKSKLLKTKLPYDLAIPILGIYPDKVKSLSHVQLFLTPWTVARQAPPSMEASILGKNTGVGCRFLLHINPHRKTSFSGSDSTPGCLHLWFSPLPQLSSPTQHHSSAWTAILLCPIYWLQD